MRFLVRITIEVLPKCLFFLLVKNKKKANYSRFFALFLTQLFFVFYTVNQWLQIDVGPPTLITGVLTKGRGDSKKKHWVTRFKISYSNDTQRWYEYKDAHSVDPRVSLLPLPIHPTPL